MNEDRLFVREILELAVVAPGLPAGVRGWTAESARRALESLRSSKVAVLAIDVYDRVVWGYALGQESWVCRRVLSEQSLEFAHRSRREGSDWINSFPRHEVLFVLEFSTQDFAAEASGHPGVFDGAG
jgi:hypothetical protein